MILDLAPIIIFVLVTTFTPGPGNLASASMGMTFGYRQTFAFLAGIVVGYLLILLLCAFMSTTLLVVLPTVEPFLRTIGSCYILWLAYNTVKASYTVSEERPSPMGFRHGFLLQTLNPKAMIFGLTIFTTFLSGIIELPLLLFLSCIVLATITFFSVSAWTLGGVKVQKYLHIQSVRVVVNLTLTALLLYCAVVISGVLK